jgi:membrane protease YdiL (CAAX protease family)
MNYIEQAYKGKNEWYHWLFTIVIVFFGWQLLGAIPLTMAGWAKSNNAIQFAEFAKDNFMTAGLDKNLLLILMLVMFLFELMFFFIGVKYIHQRSFISLITSRTKVDWKRFFFGFFVWGILAVSMTYASISLAPENFIWNFNAAPFFTLVAISIIFIPFQTGFEELLFRGYFMQGIGILAKNRWVPLVVTSLVFGLLHGTNP